MDHKQKPLLIAISAPSGGGKTTLCQQLLNVCPNIARAVTCTTRAPRAGEKDGIDYYFMDKESFQKRVAAGDFLEHAVVFGNLYGTLKSEVLGKLRAGMDVLLNIDVQGAATIRLQAESVDALRNALVSVFLTPPSLAILEERLRRRGTDAPEVIQLRLKTARHELERWVDFDYLILSSSISEDLRRMQVIMEAEKMKRGRTAQPDFGED